MSNSPDPKNKKESKMANLSIRNLQKGFDGHQIIKGIDLDVKDREFVVFVGPSGCGKSTLL
ncbi:hypothetical protein ALP71_04402, partial [Pseudomonas coronafaciens pv. garcae]